MYIVGFQKNHKINTEQKFGNLWEKESIMFDATS